MLGEESMDPATNGDDNSHRRTHSRSVSWTDQSLATRRQSLAKNKGRSLLPPLRPLSINKRNIQGWPSGGSDDIGVWPLTETPQGRGLITSTEFQLKRDKLAFYDKECSRIAEHVYLGSDTVAKNHELLRKNGITHVLNCVGFVCPEYFKNDFVYKTLWLQDSPTEDITSILYDVFDYFEDVRQQCGRVLVHCCQGVSRSTSLVIAYVMWRNGQSFEDAFNYVKKARGVTNPNMGFASQLLQCQKRVVKVNANANAAPPSPTSVLRMYRMAPHSPYDPLHLVPKMVNKPCGGALDSRGAFIIHVPSGIYVWIGKDCSSVMSCNARSAAIQVVRYEKSLGPIHCIYEDKEPKEFWVALANHQLLSCDDKEEVQKDVVLFPCEGTMEIDDDAADMGIRPRKVDEYDLDFGIFHKALVGGVVPPFSVSNTGSETCLPVRENSWGKLRRKLANSIMKGLFTSSKCCDKDESRVNMGEEKQHSVVDPLPPSSKDLCGCLSDYIEFVPTGKDLQLVNHFVPSVDSSLPVPPSPPRTSDYFPCFLSSSRKFNSESKTLSPFNSFTSSQSSTIWSDLSSMPSRQPSPSGLEPTESFYEVPSSLHKEIASSFPKEVLADHKLVGTNSFLPCKGSKPSIAERRGWKLPPQISESSRAHKILVTSKTFSLPD